MVCPMCARPLRVQYPGAFYHVMNRGTNRQNIFKDDKDREVFLRLVEETIRQWKIEVHAFCLMSNHYHMLIRTPLANLSRAMRHINGVYTQRYNRKWNRDGQIFRGRYKAILVEDEAYLVELLRYIHLNPVEKQLVKNPEKYKWSSHGHYLKEGGMDWLTTKLLLSYFSKQKGKARRKLHEFVWEGVPKKLCKLLNKKRWPSVMGAEHFQEWVKWNFVKDIDLTDVQYVSDRNKILSTNEIRKIILERLDCSWKELCQASGYRSKRLRRIAIRVMYKYGHLTYDEICRLFGRISPSTITRAISDKIISDDPEWKMLEYYIDMLHFTQCKT